MVLNDGQLHALTDRFHAAALDGKTWEYALDGLAQATGSKGGQLISVGNDASVPLNIMTNAAPELLEAFIEGNGGDSNVNPRVKAGMESPVLKVMAEADFMTPEEHRRHPHYNSFARPFDIPYICLATLDRKRDGLIGLAVNRSERDGHITPEQKRVFATIAPHVRAAVRTHIALEGHGDALLSGALEAMSIPAFICDGTGHVRKLTPSAEAVIVDRGGLHMRLGSLCATLPEETKALYDAIDLAKSDLHGRGTLAPRNRTVVVRSSERDATPLVLDVIALPNHQFGFTFIPRVLVLVRGAGAQAAETRRSAILRSCYGMTDAETEIALQLFAGKTPETIALGRAVSVATVRTQIKALLTKAGVHRQVELVARLSQI